MNYFFLSLLSLQLFYSLFASQVGYAKACPYAAGAGPGGGPVVKVFNEKGQNTNSFFAFSPNVTAGLNVAVGRFISSDQCHIAVSFRQPPTYSGDPYMLVGPVVALFKTDGTPIYSFFAYDPAMTSGVNLASGPVLYGNKDYLVTSPEGNGAGPHVKVFELTQTAVFLRKSFFAYAPIPSNFIGVRLAVGKIDRRQSLAQIFTAQGKGGSHTIRRFDAEGTLHGEFDMDIPDSVNDPVSSYGYRLAMWDHDGDGVSELAVSSAKTEHYIAYSFPWIDGLPPYSNAFAVSIAYTSKVVTTLMPLIALVNASTGSLIQHLEKPIKLSFRDTAFFDPSTLTDCWFFSQSPSYPNLCTTFNNYLGIGPSSAFPTGIPNHVSINSAYVQFFAHAGATVPVPPPNTYPYYIHQYPNYVSLTHPGIDYSLTLATAAPKNGEKTDRLLAGSPYVFGITAFGVGGMVEYGRNGTILSQSAPFGAPFYGGLSVAGDANTKYPFHEKTSQASSKTKISSELSKQSGKIIPLIPHDELNRYLDQARY